ncbi:SpvB/TcaC N-terminal domain-containing protein [Parapedobacter sp.]
MKEQTENKDRQFFDTQGGRTEPNALTVPAISLPNGGGAIKGIDEKFEVNAVNGTAACTIPLPFFSARGMAPALTLSYNSGAGNGVFGLGWHLNLPSIKRKTDKELPEYTDSDTFLFSEAEDLVPAFMQMADGSFEQDAGGAYVLHEKESADGVFIIRYYRPRIEGLFAKIERWQHKTNGELKWRVITKDNVTTLFGWTAQSRIADPNNEYRIYEWLPEWVFDDKGNLVQYRYKKEDGIGVDHSLPHNRNRLKNGTITYTHTYLDGIRYGNQTPYCEFGDPYPQDDDYLFEVVFDYGQYNANAPYDRVADWEWRHDSFSNYKAGFEIRTARICRRVLFFNHFNGDGEYNGLVRSLNLGYDEDTEKGFTFLKSATQIGYIRRADGSYTRKQLPPMKFDYQRHGWNDEVCEISLEELVHAPTGLGEPLYQFTDLYQEGLAGILTEQAGGWYYKKNLGDGTFGQAELITPKPAFAGLDATMHLADLDADGGRQLVSYKAGYPGFFELDDNTEWQGFRAFQHVPNIDLADRNVRMLDLNGDGRPEALISEGNLFTWYASAGRDGFFAAKKVQKPTDEEVGPHLVFADLEETIFLADMSGDGLTDIVRIRNGEVCYWPNLGYGNFGTKVTFDNAPQFDHPDNFNPAYFRLADIDGSGTTDIIYLGQRKFSCWRNLSGNSFGTEPFEIEAFPEIHGQANITVTDLLGNGVPCIVWSSPFSKDANAPLRYIDLMNGKKPHIMTAYENSMGKSVSWEYTPSTKFYLDDKKAGKPWVTKLHFPVHCVSRVTTRDHVSGYRFTREYRYHHGYYDHTEREFRGFGAVEQVDTERYEHWVREGVSNVVDEPLHQTPVISKTWYHTGAFFDRENLLTHFKNDYWYAVAELQGFPVVQYEMDLPDARLVAAPGLSDAVLDSLGPAEWQEALRACKGMSLRSEVFEEGEITPHAVSSHNCIIELVQPKGANKHAVFVVKEGEAISYQYERNPEDPRIAHRIHLKLDEYGNVLEAVEIAYPRKVIDAALPAATQSAQDETIIIHTENRYTNDVNTDDAYRLRLPVEVKTHELRGVAKAGDYYRAADFEAILTDSRSEAVEYHERHLSLIPGRVQRRLVEHIRTTYYRNDLSGPLPLYQLQSLALPFENYQLAYTPALVADIFGTKVNATLLTEGKFTHSEGDDNWWVRSGITQFIGGSESAIDAANRFFVPTGYKDPYGAVTKVRYSNDYFLFVAETEDAFGNKVSVQSFNYRTLTPQQMRDANGNLSVVCCDELGLVKATAVMGKGNEADELTGLTEWTDAAETALIRQFFDATDSAQLTQRGKALLGPATTRFLYDVEAFVTNGGALTVATISREQHFNTQPDAPVQLAFAYSNGLGEVVMNKVQAEPGEARQVLVQPDNTISVVTVDTAEASPKQLRWIGNGRIVKNNKGNAVKQYEPYFSVTHRYEDHRELVETGVTPVMYYDALGRLVKTEMPDGTFSKVEFDAWKQVAYDANDTVLETDWYHRRSNRLMDAELLADGKDPGREKQAADKAAEHANTFGITHFDTLGRSVCSVEHNRDLQTGDSLFYYTTVALDAEGCLLSVTDARGNTVMAYQYDILGNKVWQRSMDAGQRWLLMNIAGSPLRTWDERDHEFQYFYDILQRPTLTKVVGGGSPALDHIVGRVIYGDSLLLPDRGNESVLQARNILGQPIQQYDTGGLVDTPDYDFKGRPLATTRRLFRKYKEVGNWTAANLVADLESESFTFATECDALGRIMRQIAPDGSIITPAYNGTGLLRSETVLLPGATSETVYIRDIGYNEKGLRDKIVYGNGVVTRYHYDSKTFRLKRLESRRANNDPLQDWRYTYDPQGNVTHVEDRNIPTVFFDNQKITGISEYMYDALYRLVGATGRENHAALTFAARDNWNDAGFRHELNPADPIAMRHYTQHYQYDAVGNILEMRHEAAGNNWTRDYTYAINNNRLISTKVGTHSYPYTYHAEHGYLTELPHLEELGWNFREEVVKTVRQRRTDGGTPETTWYQYDGNGQRIRKITENQAAPGATPPVKEHRVYMAGYERYTKQTGAHAGLERVTLNLMDEGHRFAMIETRNAVDDGTEKQLVRYQLGNHLGSNSLELDDGAQIISYEEYHPYGTTAYQARNAAIRSAAKRYRYTGMERDEETGLGYHSARYYLPWLGRWLSADPIGIGADVNRYAYCTNNPINKCDPSGKDPDDPTSLSLGPFQLSNIALTDQSQFHLDASLGINNIFSSNRSVVINDLSANGTLGFTSDLSLPAFNLSGTAGLQLNLDQLRYNGEDFAATMSGRSNITIGPSDMLQLDIDATATGRMTVPREVFLSNWREQLDESIGTFRGEATVTARAELGPLVGFARLNATADEGLSADLSATGYLRWGGYHLVDISGTGTASAEGYQMSGSFAGNFPLALWGDWSLDSDHGFTASGHYFGPQFGPLGLNVGIDPFDPAYGGDAPRNDGLLGTGDITLFEPGMSVGYTYFNYGSRGSFIFSAGISPTSSLETYNRLQPRIPMVGSLPIVGDSVNQFLYGRSFSTPTGPYFGVRLGGSF